MQVGNALTSPTSHQLKVNPMSDGKRIDRAVVGFGVRETILAGDYSTYNLSKG